MSKTPQRPRLRVLTEGFVIVASILLAFGIDAWWDGRQERAEEQRLLVSLADEFATTRDSLSRALEAHRDYQEQAERIVLLVQEGDDVPNVRRGMAEIGHQIRKYQVRIIGAGRDHWRRAVDPGPKPRVRVLTSDPHQIGARS